MSNVKIVAVMVTMKVTNREENRPQKESVAIAKRLA